MQASTMSENEKKHPEPARSGVSLMFGAGNGIRNLKYESSTKVINQYFQAISQQIHRPSLFKSCQNYQIITRKVKVW